MFHIMLSHNSRAGHTLCRTTPTQTQYPLGFSAYMHDQRVPCYNIYSRGEAKRNYDFRSHRLRSRDTKGSSREIWHPFHTLSPLPLLVSSISIHRIHTARRYSPFLHDMSWKVLWGTISFLTICVT